MMHVYLMELSGQAGSMTSQVERMPWKCWGGFPGVGPLGRELRVHWSYPWQEREVEEGRRPERECGVVVRERGRAQAGAAGGRGYAAHLEDQAERVVIKADPPLSPLIRIIRSFPLHPSQVYRPLCPLPAPTHFAPRGRDGLLSFPRPPVLPTEGWAQTAH